MPVIPFRTIGQLIGNTLYYNTEPPANVRFPSEPAPPTGTRFISDGENVIPEVANRPFVALATDMGHMDFITQGIERASYGYEQIFNVAAAATIGNTTPIPITSRVCVNDGVNEATKAGIIQIVKFNTGAPPMLDDGTEVVVDVMQRPSPVLKNLAVQSDLWEGATPADARTAFLLAADTVELVAELNIQSFSRDSITISDPGSDWVNYATVGDLVEIYDTLPVGAAASNDGIYVIRAMGPDPNEYQIAPFQQAHHPIIFSTNTNIPSELTDLGGSIFGRVKLWYNGYFLGGAEGTPIGVEITTNVDLPDDTAYVILARSPRNLAARYQSILDAEKVHKGALWAAGWTRDGYVRNIIKQIIWGATPAQWDDLTGIQSLETLSAYATGGLQTAYDASAASGATGDTMILVNAADPLVIELNDVGAYFEIKDGDDYFKIEKTSSLTLGLGTSELDSYFSNNVTFRSGYRATTGYTGTTAGSMLLHAYGWKFDELELLTKWEIHSNTLYGNYGSAAVLVGTGDCIGSGATPAWLAGTVSGPTFLSGTVAGPELLSGTVTGPAMLSGTVSGTSGSKILTGIGTTFLSDFVAFDQMAIPGFVNAPVGSVESDTQITMFFSLSETFNGEEYTSYERAKTILGSSTTFVADFTPGAKIIIDGAYTRTVNTVISDTELTVTSSLINVYTAASYTHEFGYKTVTGSATTFTTDFPAPPVPIIIDGVGEYTVSSVDDDTHLIITTGIVSPYAGANFTGGSAASEVIGTSTTFTTDFTAGQSIIIDTSGTYEILSIADNTHLQLVDSLVTSISGVNYTLLEPNPSGVVTGSVYISTGRSEVTDSVGNNENTGWIDITTGQSTGRSGGIELITGEADIDGLVETYSGGIYLETGESGWPSITGGGSNTTGNIELCTGDSYSGTSGGVIITTGNSYYGWVGDVDISTGIIDKFFGNDSSGNIYIHTGENSSYATSGNVEIETGVGWGTSGDVKIRTGGGLQPDDTGEIHVISGDAYEYSGHVYVSTGDCTDTSGKNSGNVIITTGDSKRDAGNVLISTGDTTTNSSTYKWGADVIINTGDSAYTYGVPGVIRFEPGNTYRGAVTDRGFRIESNQANTTNLHLRDSNSDATIAGYAHLDILRGGYGHKGIICRDVVQHYNPIAASVGGDGTSLLKNSWAKLGGTFYSFTQMASNYFTESYTAQSAMLPQFLEVEHGSRAAGIYPVYGVHNSLPSSYFDVHCYDLSEEIAAMISSSASDIRFTQPRIISDWKYTDTYRERDERFTLSLLASDRRIASGGAENGLMILYSAPDSGYGYTVEVSGQIDGGAPPAVVNGAHYIVTTAGGSYELREIYFGDTTWKLVTAFDRMTFIATANFSGGTDSYNIEYIYEWDGITWNQVSSGYTSKLYRKGTRKLIYCAQNERSCYDPDVMDQQEAFSVDVTGHVRIGMGELNQRGRGMSSTIPRAMLDIGNSTYYPSGQPIGWIPPAYGIRLWGENEYNSSDAGRSHIRCVNPACFDTQNNTHPLMGGMDLVSYLYDYALPGSKPFLPVFANGGGSLFMDGASLTTLFGAGSPWASPTDSLPFVDYYLDLNAGHPDVGYTYSALGTYVIDSVDGLETLSVSRAADDGFTNFGYCNWYDNSTDAPPTLTFTTAAQSPISNDVLLTGTVTVGTGGTAVVGVGTLFTTEVIGAGTIEVTIEEETRRVSSISDDTHLVLVDPHTAGATGKAIYKTWGWWSTPQPTVADDGNHYIVQGVGWPYGATHEDLVTWNADSKTGTVSVGAGTNTVTGVGTLFLTELSSGDYVSIAGEIHEVDVVSTDLSMTLVANHVAGAAGASYYLVYWTSTTPNAGTRTYNTTLGKWYYFYGPGTWDAHLYVRDFVLRYIPAAAYDTTEHPSYVHVRVPSEHSAYPSMTPSGGAHNINGVDVMVYDPDDASQETGEAIWLRGYDLHNAGSNRGSLLYVKGNYTNTAAGYGDALVRFDLGDEVGTNTAEKGHVLYVNEEDVVGTNNSTVCIVRKTSTGGKVLELQYGAAVAIEFGYSTTGSGTLKSTSCGGWSTVNAPLRLGYIDTAAAETVKAINVGPITVGDTDYGTGMLLGVDAGSSFYTSFYPTSVPGEIRVVDGGGTPNTLEIEYQKAFPFQSGHRSYVKRVSTIPTMPFASGHITADSRTDPAAPYARTDFAESYLAESIATGEDPHYLMLPIDIDQGMLFAGCSIPVNQRKTVLTTLTGTVSVTSGLAAVTGVGTLFETELIVGESIIIAGETHKIAAITSPLLLTLATTHTAGAAGVSYTTAFGQSFTSQAWLCGIRRELTRVLPALNGVEVDSIAATNREGFMPYDTGSAFNGPTSCDMSSMVTYHNGANTGGNSLYAHTVTSSDDTSYNKSKLLDIAMKVEPDSRIPCWGGEFTVHDTTAIAAGPAFDTYWVTFNEISAYFVGIHGHFPGFVATPNGDITILDQPFMGDFLWLKEGSFQGMYPIYWVDTTGTTGKILIGSTATLTGTGAAGDSSWVPAIVSPGTKIYAQVRGRDDDGGDTIINYVWPGVAFMWVYNDIAASGFPHSPYDPISYGPRLPGFTYPAL